MTDSTAVMPTGVLRTGRGQHRHRFGQGALVQDRDRHATRCPGPLRAPSRQGGLDRIQGSPDRNLRHRQPNVIVHVATQEAPEQDISMVEPIHRALARRGLLPNEQLVDAGYVSPQAIRQAATAHAVTLLGPVRPISLSRRRPGFDKQNFTIDWEQQGHLPTRRDQPAPARHPTRGATAPLGALPPKKLPGLSGPSVLHRQHRRPRPPPGPDAAPTAGDPGPGPRRTENPCLESPLRPARGL